MIEFLLEMISFASFLIFQSVVVVGKELFHFKRLLVVGLLRPTILAIVAIENGRACACRIKKPPTPGENEARETKESNQ